MNSSRRSLLFASAVAIIFGASPPSFAQNNDLPKVKRSEARPLAQKYVDDLSQLAKENGGRELTDEEKTKMVNAILTGIEKQGVYALIDP